jgi:hypothetical protein
VINNTFNFNNTNVDNSNIGGINSGGINTTNHQIDTETLDKIVAAFVEEAAKKISLN